MKNFSILLLLFLSLTFIGCAQESDDESSGTALTASEMASFAGTGSSMSQSMSDLAIGYDSTPPSLIKAIGGDRVITSNPRSASSSIDQYTFNASTNYWDVSQTVSSSAGTSTFSYVYDMSVGLWESGSLSQTVTTLEQVTMYGTMAFTLTDSESGQSVVMNMTMGSGVSSPFTWSDIDTNTVTMNGTMSFAISAAGENITMTMTFTNMTIDTSGSNTYPTGTMSLSASAGGTSFSGTVVYDGTSTAVATVDGTSVDVNLASTAITSLIK